MDGVSGSKYQVEKANEMIGIVSGILLSTLLKFDDLASSSGH